MISKSAGKALVKMLITFGTIPVLLAGIDYLKKQKQHQHDKRRAPKGR